MTLFGRDAELELISSFVRPGVPVASPVLILSGEPGAGKTALLDAAADCAGHAGRRVLRVTALEYEAELNYGALNQILYPLLDQLPALEEVHQRAIAVMCGLEAGPPPAQLIAGAAVLALVTAAAKAAPLFIVIDDVPWLDLPSGMVLTYAARRLRDADVRLIVAARFELENVFVRSGFDAHILRPLSEESANALLAERFPALPAVVRGRIMTDAAGNPLALLDLPAALEGVARPSDDPLPLTERLGAIYAGRLRSLPRATRDVLLFVVLAGAEHSVTFENLLPTRSQEDLEPAARAGIVRVNPRTGRMKFRHPLIRSAVFEQSSAEERRHAHALLAEAFAAEPKRRAWHLGQSASGPDEAIAGLLEVVSDELLQSGDGGRATAAMLRAAELSTVIATRGRRLARAAYLGSLVTGGLQDAPRLLASAHPDPFAAPSLAHVTAAAYHLLNSEGDASSAHRLLIVALDASLGGLDARDEQTVEAVATLLLVSFYAGRPDFSEATRSQVRRFVPAPPETIELLDGAFSDPARADAGLLDWFDAALDRLGFTSNPVLITRMATAGAYLDRVHRAVDPLWRVVEDGRRGGAVAKEIEALFLIGNDAWFAGRWDELERVTDDGLRLCDELGYALTAAPGRYLRGLLDAARGREDVADRAAEQVLLWAAPRRLYALAAYASHIRCMLQLPHGRFESAYRHAASVSPAGTLQPFLPHAVWLVFDLVEAAVRSGRSREAAAHVRAAEEAGLAKRSSRLGMLVTAAGALVAETGWRERFERALSTPGAERWVFDRARVRLVYGEQLRRAQSPGEARTQLDSALGSFRALGAEPWAARALRELHASGGGAPGVDALTPQEAAVARLAATGLTNKQIGAQLFLSPRTVSTHLSRVFPKLGVESRAALRDALTGSRPVA